jgi:hypothetical protein
MQRRQGLVEFPIGFVGKLGAMHGARGREVVMSDLDIERAHDRCQRRLDARIGELVRL